MSKNNLSRLILFLLLTFPLLILNKTTKASLVIDAYGNVIINDEGEVLSKRDNPGKSGKVEDTDADTESESVNKPIRLNSKIVEIEKTNNKVKLTPYDETDAEGVLEDDELVINEDSEKNAVRIRANENAYMVIRNKVAAKTNFPLMVNTETNELIVTTPKGSKVVTVLPDKAVDNMLAANVLDQAGGKGALVWNQYQEQERERITQETTTATGFPDEVNSSDMIKLTTKEDGTLAYEIEGIKNKKLFGLFGIKLNRTALVSAETGELLELKQDLLTRLLDLVSL